MAKRRFGSLILLLCFCLCMLPGRAQAASTTDAKEFISTEKNCLLTIHYSCNGVAFAGQTVNLYKIAHVSADAAYTLTSSFAATGLVLNGIQTNSEWNVVRATLEAYILANNIAPTMSVVTDENADACFGSLKPGLYLISAVEAEQDDWSCAFDSALVALPGLETDGYWQYEVAVAAKAEILPPIEPDGERELRVVKLWKGDEGRTERPASIEVDLFRDGTKVATVVLSEENHWSYSWIVEDDGANWMVYERNVPSGYAMTVVQREETFVLTNTWSSDDPSDQPPKTGESIDILLCSVLMYVSGTALIILGIAGKRLRHEKTNESEG